MKDARKKNVFVTKILNSITETVTLKQKKTHSETLSNSKLNEEKCIGIESVDIAEPKTKSFKAILDALNLTGKSLFVVDNIDDKVKKASRTRGS